MITFCRIGGDGPLKQAVLLSIDEDLDEMRALLRTLGVSVVREIIQRRESPHRNAFLGPGKVEEVKEELHSLEFDYVVVNGNLRPSQHHTLEMLFQKECLDRVGVILRIFADHAHTEEAKNQVTLATLRYELPFLREWIHKAKSGERPGFLSGGAYATEVYYEHAKSHIKRIEERLENRSRQREIRRSRRRKQGFYLVSLAGYTNAGKSALLNALSDSQELVDDRLFATLSTATRSLKGSRRNILLTDTVGFIGGLPPDLIDAFTSTMEEIFLADLVLLVVDVSESFEVINHKLTASLEILIPRLNGRSLIIVGNKVDQLSGPTQEDVRMLLKSAFPSSDPVTVSASTHEGLDRLVTALEVAEGRSVILRAHLPMTDAAMSILSEFHDVMDVEETRTDENIEISLLCRPDEVTRISGKIRSVNGVVRTTP
jgi:GTP-binding protein HflX